MNIENMAGAKWSIFRISLYPDRNKKGYSRLVAFELARITTRVLGAESPPVATHRKAWTAIPDYNVFGQGFLPQGAPSSPMLSNLVMKPADEIIGQLASARGFRYTRYADDLAFSINDVGARGAVFKLKREVIAVLASYGFTHNGNKTAIRGPGARRLVLGMHVDGPAPRLSREFKDQIRLHLHYLRHPAYGVAQHAKARRTSVSSIYHHVRGLIAWAQRVEPQFGAECLGKFEAIDWPPISSLDGFSRTK